MFLCITLRPTLQQKNTGVRGTHTHKEHSHVVWVWVTLTLWITLRPTLQQKNTQELRMHTHKWYSREDHTASDVSYSIRAARRVVRTGALWLPRVPDSCTPSPLTRHSDTSIQAIILNAGPPLLFSHLEMSQVLCDPWSKLFHTHFSKNPFHTF